MTEKKEGKMMLRNQNYCKKQHDYFSYVDKPIDELLCSSNRFHDDMGKVGRRDGRLITFGEKPLIHHSIDVSEMITEYGVMNEDIAKSSAEELRNNGLALPLGIERNYKNSLIYAYILNSCLCYVEVNKKNGVKECFYATKNMDVYAELHDELADSQKKKQFDRIQSQFTTTYLEVSSGIFEVVKLTPDRDGLQLSKQRANSNSKDTVIIPMYSIGYYIDYLLHLLSNHRAVVTFTENGEKQKLITSLKYEALAKWMNTNEDNAIEKVQESWNNPFVFGEIILPDLFSCNDYVTVSVLDITSVQEVD
jgi:hypothetical protein